MSSPYPPTSSFRVEYAEFLYHRTPARLDRFIECSLPPLIGSPVHALRFRREGIGEARVPPKPPLNLVRSVHRLGVASFPLARITQPMTPPTAKVSTAKIELGHAGPADATGPHARAHKPGALSSIVTRGPDEGDGFFHILPFFTRLPAPVRQEYPPRLHVHADGSNGFSLVVRPIRHEPHAGTEELLPMPLPHIKDPRVLDSGLRVPSVP
jgi:hypothetical protein